MKLKKVAATGLKGSDFEYELGDCTVFFGRNFRGKSRVMDAIRVGILGYLPELGKTNKDTFGLASEKEMTVTLTFDSGQMIFRRWKLAGNAVKTEHEVPESLKSVSELAVMFNAEEYFGLSDRKRVDYVFANCARGIELPDVWKRVERLLDGKYPENMAAVSALVTNGISAGGAVEDFPDPQAYMEKQIEVVTEIYKLAKQDRERAEKTIQGLTGMRLNDEAVESLAVLEPKRSVLAQELNELNMQLGELKAQHERMIKDRGRRETLNRELMTADRRRADLSEAEQKLSALVGVEPVAEQQVQDAFEAVLHTAADIRRVNEEIGRIKAEQEKVRKQVADLDGQQKCPYCGAAGDGWKALRAAEYETASSDWKRRADELAEKLTAAEHAHNKANAEHTRLVERRDTFNRCVEQRTQLENQVASLKQIIELLAVKAEERDRLMPNDPELATNVEMLNKQIALKQSELREIDARIKNAQGREFELKRLADAEHHRDVAKLDVEMATDAGKELRVIQGEVVESAFAPLLARANSFFGDVLMSPLAYNAKEGGEIGTWRDGLWVGHKTFSGTEKALTYAAIQAALVMESPLKLVLIDELGRLDSDSLEKVILAFCEATAGGLIDGFVGIDAGRGMEYRGLAVPVSGLKVVEID